MGAGRLCGGDSACRQRSRREPLRADNRSPSSCETKHFACVLGCRCKNEDSYDDIEAEREPRSLPIGLALGNPEILGAKVPNISGCIVLVGNRVL